MIKNDNNELKNKKPPQNHRTTSSLEFTEKIDAESLLKDFKVTNTENLNVYLQQLSKDFCSRSDNPGLGISKSTFLEYFSLPGIIGERLYSIFDQNNIEYIAENDFISGMTKFYSGSFEYLCQFVFNLYDCDNDGLISKEDVRLVLSYIPLEKTKIQTEEIAFSKKKRRRKNTYSS